DAFGNQKQEQAEDNNPFRYCGEYFDNETGFIYLRARYYDSDIGRFTSEDTHWNPANNIYDKEETQNKQKAQKQYLILKHINNLYISSNMSLEEKLNEVARWKLGQLTDEEEQTIENEISGIQEPSIKIILQSSNLYVYGINNPNSYIDPSGNFAITASATTAAIIAAAKAVGVAIASTAAIIAVVETIEAIQKANNNAVFYEAWISGGSVKTGRKLSTAEAAVRVIFGKSVYSKSKTAAYNLAKMASGGKEPVHDNPHGVGSGYKSHYHLHGRKNGSHIWYW
ncbi:RHS repeat-associated core domain-containing protein, partial [Acetivibrio sp. MSJd-27]|uniref:RHS repeat-associated core domain-containing protein n=1 Tax=Acetivibrio sp. MSJd-27 TaxID=2841523 RepID=UPI001C117D5F